jgi:uncharacterized glyoxalase superfamily protein PhnB
VLLYGCSMIANRSVPHATVIPELAYADVNEAADWLQDVFGFTVRLRIGDHRVQLVYGDGAVIATELHASAPGPDAAHALLVRVEDANRHHEHTVRHGAHVLRPPQDYPYGERQYTAEDLGGHVWTFSESIADVDPVSWGGTPVDLG